MNVAQTGTAGGAVTQMSHINLAHKGFLTLNLRWGEVFHIVGSKPGENPREYLLNGLGAERAFAPHVFSARLSIELHHTHTCAFLAAVVLLLHHQIELFQSVTVSAVFLFIISERFAEAYHHYSAFMFELFHCIRRFLIKAQK